MAGPGLTTNVDSTYVDNAQDASVKVHQQDHDKIANLLNIFDIGVAPTDGKAYIYNAASGLYKLATPSGAAGAAGTSFLWLGQWSSATTYHIREAVYYGGNSYISLTTHTNSVPQVDANNQPISSANWDVLAAGGQDGLTIVGPKGDPGVGLPGPSAERLQSFLNFSGVATIDGNNGSYVEMTLSGHATITLDDTSGSQVSALTFRIKQAGSGSNTIDWVNASWALTGGAPPTLGTAVGAVNVVSFDQVKGEWVGYAPGAGTGTTPPVIVPPPDVWLDLLMEALADAADTTNKVDTNGLASYVMGSNVQVGNKRGGLVAVVVVTDNSLDPPVPTLVGAGASSWHFCITKTFGTAANRRRISLFAARDALSAAAAPFTVSMAGAGMSYVGCWLKAVRTSVIVEPTFVDTAIAKAVARAYSDAGETSLAPRVTLASPDDALNRGIMFEAGNVATTFTPEAGLVEIGSVLNLGSPTIQGHAVWDDTAFDTTPSSTITNTSNWAVVATEMERGGTFTPPPVGIPPIDLEVILVGFDTTDQTADYVTSAGGFVASVGAGTSVLFGNARMGIVDVANSTTGSVDPVQPTLAGGGMTTWTVAATRVIGASTNRRRLTRFIGWQTTAGAAAPLTVGVSAQATTSISIQAFRTPTTDTAQKTLALANTKMRYYLDAGENAAGPARIAAGDPLAAPQDSDSRFVATMIANAAATAMDPIVAEAGSTLLVNSDSANAPATKMVSVIGNDNTFDTTPSISWNGATLNWTIIATELGQAV